MKNTVLFVLLLCFCSLASAQWTNVSTGKTGHILLSHAIDASTCIGVGTFGKIYRTADGGMTFDSVQTVFSSDIFGTIEFINDSVGYIAGGSWFGLHHCFLLRTRNRGVTWDSITSEVGTNGYYTENICFLDEQIGFMATDEGVLFKTTDGGQNFAPTSLAGNPGVNVTDIDFPTDQIGYVSSWQNLVSGAKGYRIDKTTDQGQSWATVYSDSLMGAHVGNDRLITSLYFSSAAEGFAGGANALLMHTTDGGQSWSQTTLSSDTSTLNQIQFTDPLHGYISNSFAYGGQARPFFYTSDGGQSWTRQPFEFYDMSMIGAAGYAVGNGYNLFATQTGGLHATSPAEEIQLEAFPNPVGDRLNVRVAHAYLGSKLTIRDMSGKLLRELILRQTEQSIDIHGLAFGTYLLTLEHPEKGSISKKFAVVGF